MIRRGFTMIEVLVVFALLSVLSTLAWDFMVGASKQGAQVEDGSDLIRSALLLQERLTGELEGALPLRTLPPQMTVRDTPMSSLILPVYFGYRGDSDRAIRYKPTEYLWDPAKKKLFRDGQPIFSEGIAKLSFQWTASLPTKLIIDLEGEASTRKVGTKFRIQLPAPPGTDGLPIWKFAAHHQSADVANAP